MEVFPFDLELMRVFLKMVCVCVCVCVLLMKGGE